MAHGYIETPNSYSFVDDSMILIRCLGEIISLKVPLRVLIYDLLYIPGQGIRLGNASTVQMDDPNIMILYLYYWYLLITTWITVLSFLLNVLSRLKNTEKDTDYHLSHFCAYMLALCQ